MRIGELQDIEAVASSLTRAGVSPEAAARLQRSFVRAADALRAHGLEAAQPAHAFFVPGRIEVLGKHTDYAGGSSLTCAVERGFAVAAVPGGDPALRLTDAASGATAAFSIDAGLAARPGHWSNYARTVARRVARNFSGVLQGGHVAFVSDLPRAAGMSSSSALIVAVFLVLSAFNDLSEHPAYRANIAACEELAHYLGCVENGQTFGTLAGDRGVGTFGGSEDHTAILCSEPGVLRRYGYAPTRFERAVPLPAGYVFVIGASGVVAAKTGRARAAYNRATRLAHAALEAWRTATGRDDPHLGGAVAAPGFSRERMHAALQDAAHPGFTPGDLFDRFTHFYTEHVDILPAAVEALAAGDVHRFGVLADRSQREAERLLGNQVPETIFLAREARRLGAVAASVFGAGFGGSVWALVDAEQAARFHAMWAACYADAFPRRRRRAAFFVERAGPAAFRLLRNAK